MPFFNIPFKKKPKVEPEKSYIVKSKEPPQEIQENQEENLYNNEEEY